MAGKRSFGQISRLPSKHYRARFTGPDGRLYNAPTTYLTKLDAEAWLIDQHRAISNGTWVPRRTKTRVHETTFSEYAERWLELRDLKPSTRGNYRRLLDHHILGYFEDVPLTGVDAEGVREWYGQLDRTKPTQRAHSYALLRAILSTAVADEKIAVNPCHIRSAGVAKRARPVKPATLAELEEIVLHLPERYRPMLLLSSWCALRFGEVTELRRRDLDLDAGVIRVRRGVVRTDEGRVVGTPKSEAGIRDVAIPPHLLPILEAHLAGMPKRGGDALLFPAADGSTHLAPSSLYRVFYPARKAAGRPDLRWHDLRHTGAVLAAQTGPPSPNSWPASATRHPRPHCGTSMQLPAEMARSPRRCPAWRRGDERETRSYPDDSVAGRVLVCADGPGEQVRGGLLFAALGEGISKGPVLRALAPPASAGAAVLAAAAAPTPKVCVAAGCWVTATVDVDGDGRLDQVSSTRAGVGETATWTLRVVTARRTSAQVTYRYTAHRSPVTPGNVWFGAAALDGVKGAELVIGGDNDSSRWFQVYTWRAGKLVSGAAPAGGASWNVATGEYTYQGFTFGSSRGARTVLASHLTYSMATQRYTGPLTTYVWSKTAWKKAASRTVSLTAAQALPYAGWNRTTLPKGVTGQQPSSCPLITFSYIEDVAVEVRATNVTCAAAASFIRAVDTKIDYSKRSIAYGSYSCAIAYHPENGGLDWWEVECINGVRFIHFVRQ